MFVHCLTVLVFLEDSFNDDLLDLYLYYCMIGVGMTSPSLRAASVGMLAVLSAHSSDLVLGVVGASPAKLCVREVAATASSGIDCLLCFPPPPVSDCCKTSRSPRSFTRRHVVGGEGAAAYCCSLAIRKGC